MPEDTIERPKPLQWRLECLAHSIIEGLAGVLPGSWVFRMGEWLGSVAWYVYPDRRRIVLRNLRIAFGGEMNLPEIRALARESFRRTGANLVSAAHTARLTPEQLRKSIHVEGLDLLEDAHAAGKGVVILLAHMGNWEVLSRLIHFFPKGSKAGAFYRPLNNPLLDKRVLDRRQADGTRMFSKRDPFHQITGFLREGGLVGVLADQRIGRQGEIVRFFNRVTRASPLPCLLARRSKSIVVVFSLVTESPGKWKVVISPVESPGTTAGCMKALEESMKMSPLDVFWMQERWKAKIRRKYPPFKWLGSDTPSEDSKPLRALLWLVDSPESWEIPDAWKHPDVIYEVVHAPGQSVPDWLPESTAAHRVEAVGTCKAVFEIIESIDQSTMLPLDFILAPCRINSLADAGLRLDLPVISLSRLKPNLGPRA